MESVRIMVRFAVLLIFSSFFFVNVFLPLQAYGQVIHTPKEIAALMDSSALAFEFELDGAIEPAFDYTKVNGNHHYQVLDEGDIVLLEYDISEEDSMTLRMAESAFASGDFEMARSHYGEVTNRSPELAFPHVYIGQTYSVEEDYKEAIKWYRKAISLNYIDYMAHWFLAGALVSEGNAKEAAQEISIAYILNRNNPLILKALKNIYKEAGYDYQEWEFSPQYQFYTADDTVTIVTNDDWLWYAMVKSLWTYEAGYRESMTGKAEFTFSTLEEREGLLAILAANTKKGKWKKSKTSPEFNYLNKAVHDRNIDSFIIVEIWLRQYPKIAYTQSKETIKDLADYVVEIRGQKP